MKIVFGLGNPGKQFEKTRHNAGFMFVDALAKKLDASEWAEVQPFKAAACSAHVNGEKIIMVKPMTFMNLSGYSVGKVFRYYKADIDDLWLIYDDVDLPLGSIRIRKKSSGGTGHNGVKSINEVLGPYGSVARLRIGIDSKVTADFRGGLRDYVLTKFAPSELKTIEKTIDRGIEALLLSWKEDIYAGMQFANKKT